MINWLDVELSRMYVRTLASSSISTANPPLRVLEVSDYDILQDNVTIICAFIKICSYFAEIHYNVSLYAIFLDNASDSTKDFGSPPKSN